jgi:putative ABC transport system permease protein
VLSALIGIGLTSLLIPLLVPHLPGGFAGMNLGPQAWLQGLGIAIGLALLVGVPPALRAQRLDIVQALGGH